MPKNEDEGNSQSSTLFLWFWKTLKILLSTEYLHLNGHFPKKFKDTEPNAALLTTSDCFQFWVFVGGVFFH